MRPLPTIYALPRRAGRFLRGGPFLGPLVAAALLGAAPVNAQQRFDLGPLSGQVMAQAIGLLTTADPMPHDVAVTEARVVQPVISLGLSAFSDFLRFRGTLDLEGWTIPDGELAPGDWGEGYVDRRHPHTYAHELMLSAPDLLRGVTGPVHLSAAFGKGFVPFGTDDPMSRPVVRYPVNHHLAQILEREVAIAGVRAGPAAFEASWFNGDEPEYPAEWPSGRRFGDSYALRGTLLPFEGIEAQLSYAEVKSPEHRPGAGTPQEKWSASIRFERPVAGHPVYTLAEYARTSEAGGAFVFRSFLVEGATDVGRWRPYGRFERTERPEEPRSGSVYRTPRPILDNSLVGITRWSIVTAGTDGPTLTTVARVTVRPFVEGAVASVQTVTGAFNVDGWYGGSTIWSLSVGARVEWGMTGHRMGRYGTGPGPGAMMPGMEMDGGSE